jgi:hypothetical protein
MSPPAARNDPKDDQHREPNVTPVRAFLFSFTAGLALLFSGHGMVSAVSPQPPSGTITV